MSLSEAAGVITAVYSGNSSQPFCQSACLSNSKITTKYTIHYLGSSIIVSKYTYLYSQRFWYRIEAVFFLPPPSILVRDDRLCKGGRHELLSAAKVFFRQEKPQRVEKLASCPCYAAMLSTSMCTSTSYKSIEREGISTGEKNI